MHSVALLKGQCVTLVVLILLSLVEQHQASNDWFNDLPTSVRVPVQ